MPPWELPGDATRMGFMTRSKDGSMDNASFLFFEDSPGNESVQMHSEKDMMVSVENDKTVNVDGHRKTTIKKTQTDNVWQDATFYYKMKRTTTVDDIEKKDFNNSEITAIKNGRKLQILNGGDESKISGDRKLNLEGNNLREITGNDTTHIQGAHNKTIDAGEKITITSGGQIQNITDNVKVDIGGEWSQTVTGQINITSPKPITIKSETKVFIDSPIFERNDVQKTSFAQDAVDYIKKQFTVSVGTVALKAGSYAYTGVDVSHKGFTFGRTIVNAQRVEAARVESGSLKTAVFALFMVM